MEIIVVNAAFKKDRNWDRHKQPPSAVQVTLALGSVPMNRYSFDTLQLLKDSVREWEREWNESNLFDTSKAGNPTSTPRQIKIYTIEVNFDDIQDDEERKRIESLPTAFKLSPESVRRVREVAGKLLNQSEGYRTLLRDLEAESKN